MKRAEDVEQFEKVAKQLEKMRGEFTELSKKKPDDAVNKFKLGLVNALLDVANALLDAGNRPFASFSRFDEDAVPTNSDVLVMLSQYRACMEKFFLEHTTIDLGHRCWIVRGQVSSVQTGYTYDNTV